MWFLSRKTSRASKVNTPRPRGRLQVETLEDRCVPAAGCEWPTNEHGIFVDHMDYVYIAGNGGANHQALKFSNDGNFIFVYLDDFVDQAATLAGSRIAFYGARSISGDVQPQARTGNCCPRWCLAPPTPCP